MIRGRPPAGRTVPCSQPHPAVRAAFRSVRRVTRTGSTVQLLAGLTLRQRFSLVSSTVYIVLGIIIIVRSAVGAVLPLAIFGIVLVALGAVRIRDFIRWRRTSGAR